MKILIIGSTGELGTKLLKYIKINNLSIYAASCFTNSKKLKIQKKKYNIKYTFVLSNKIDEKKFYKLLKEKIDIVYFLDFGSYSLNYLNTFIKNNSHSIVAIANKEMIIAGGKLLRLNISKTKNKLIPLDSEHFSLINQNFVDDNISKIYITASGGPFFFKKKINLNKVSKKQVLNHPKWKMGINNSIDSSNFINKILEIFELSILFNINIKKINFVISKEAFVHSIIFFKDQTISLNAFKTDMIIPLVKPLSINSSTIHKTSTKEIYNLKNFSFFDLKDERFKILNYMNKLKALSHSEQIDFMLLNNKAQKLYLSDKIKYNEIINYIFKNLEKYKTNIKLNSFKSILNYIERKKNLYEKF